MALLIATGLTGWISDEDIRKDLAARAPDADIRTQPGDARDITMVAVSRLTSSLVQGLPNLRLVQKLGAGVETIVTHPALAPHVRVTRLKPDAPAREIAEYFLAYILRYQRNMKIHDLSQRAAAWEPVAPLEADKTTVAVLGLGHIGGRTARVMRDMGFRTLGWSASPKTIDGVDCRDGTDALADVLGQADHVCAILPSTPQTRDMMDAVRFAQMKPGATFLNAGRGDLVDEVALIQALNDGPPNHAVLDVTRTEPLPADSPLWSHPKITITPHVSGWHLGDAMKDVIENYRRLMAGDPLLHEVDRAKGY